MKTNLFVLIPHGIFPPNDGGAQGIYFRLKYYFDNKYKFNINKIIILIVIRNNEEKYMSERYLVGRCCDECYTFDKIKLRFVDILRLLPYTVYIRTSNKMKATLLSLVNKNFGDRNIFLVESPYMYEYTKLFKNVSLFLKMHNVESCFLKNRANSYSKFNPLHYFYLIEYLKMLRYENKIFREGKVCKYFFVSKKEASLVKEKYLFKNEIVFSPPGLVKINNLDVAALKSTEKIKLLFYGTGKLEANYYSIEKFINGSFQLIKKEIKDVNLTICGGNYETIKNIYKNDNITYLGFVNNLEEVIKSSDIIILPLIRGSGVKLKFIESMSYNKPVIATKIAAEGTDFVDNEDFFLVEKPNDYVNAIKTIRTNPDLVEKMNKSKLIKCKNYLWDVIADKELKIICG